MNLTKIVLGASAAVSCAVVGYQGKKLVAAQKEYELVHVQVIFRHGARTPLHIPSYIPTVRYDESLLEHASKTIIPYELVTFSSSLPESPFEESYKHRGKLEGGCLPGQLTHVGADQMYQLGLYLKKRYLEDERFLSSSYSGLLNEIYTRSTNIERTIMSARCVLAGIFSGKSGSDVLQIHVTPPNEEIMYPNYYTCNYLRLLTRWAWSHPEKIPGVSAIQEMVRKPLSISDKDTADLVSIRDNIAVEEAHNKPSVGSKLSLKTRDIVEEGAMKIMHTAFVGEENVRERSLKLAIGPFVDIIMNNIEVKSEGKDSSNIKMHLYSGHDTTLIPLLSALGIRYAHWPPYAGNVIIELHRKNNASGKEPSYFVRMLYNGEEQPVGRWMKYMCPLNEFQDSVADIRIAYEDYSKQCMKTED
uniref:lysophosphatidic acid phosphatase type 6-like n=1 Tax=Styela clava TaxID=7725 RepID=UPI00193AC2D9|nr:lysophosphatidic acid phosphatase type 6-like [Styela clava]